MIIDSTRSFSYQKIAAGLARSLAHEVKNPLSGIKGSAQILKKKYSDDFSKKFLKRAHLKSGISEMCHHKSRNPESAHFGNSPFLVAHLRNS